MNPRPTPGLDVTQARLCKVTQYALGARLALETDPYLRDYDQLVVIESHLERAQQHVREGNAPYAHSSVESANSVLSGHPMYRVHARRPGEQHLRSGEQVALVGSVKDRDQVIGQLHEAGWHFTFATLATHSYPEALPPLTGPITLPVGTDLADRISEGLPPGLCPQAFALLLTRLADAWRDVEAQEQMCPLWCVVASHTSQPILNELPAPHRSFVWDLLYPHGLHSEPLDCPRASDLRALSKRLVGERGGHGEAALGMPDLLAEIADLWGRFKDGYSADDVRRVFGRISDAGGPHLVCVWDYADEYGFGGNSKFYAEDEEGRFLEVEPGIYRWLTGEQRSPGPVNTWVVGPVAEPIEFAVGDDFHNYARSEA